jgi:phosphate:Na+ symporter
LTTTDFWKLIAGLGMFLYGMFHLEDAIKQFEGRTFKLFLQKHTKNKLSAIFSGTIVTGVLQSSSIVNLMVLSFVGAGMLSMRNALGVALGANVGGTFNSWLVALLGFKIDIGLFTFPIIGISGIGLIVFRNKKTLYQVSKFFMGFGLLFLGLDFMKESMDSLIKEFNFNPYLSYPKIVFVLIGFIITALVQTSAATVVIVLSALYASIIPIETAVAVVLGAELGTTIKLIIGSIGGIAAKKRVAFGNALFNVVTSLFGFILLTPIIHLIKNVFGIQDPILILVSFQTFINIAGVVLFYYFLNYFADFLERRFVNDKKSATYFIQNASPEISDTAIEMLEKEVGFFIYRIIRLNMEVFQLENNSKSEYENCFKEINTVNNATTYLEKYNLLKRAEGEILAFYSKASEEQFGKEDKLYLNQLIVSLRNAMYSAKGMKDIVADRKEFGNSVNELKFGVFKIFSTKLQYFYDELNQLLLINDKLVLADKLMLLLEKIRKDYEEILQNSIKNAGKDVLKELDISTLFNLNRELYSSSKAIIFSIKDYKLEDLLAEKFENLPSEFLSN